MPPSSLAVAPAVAAASLLVLAGKHVLYRTQTPRLGQTTKTILACNIARFLGCLVLLSLSVTSPILRAYNHKLHSLSPSSFLPAAVFVRLGIPTSLGDLYFHSAIRVHSRVLRFAHEKSVDVDIPS